jgi:hypothetical protein
VTGCHWVQVTTALVALSCGGQSVTCKSAFDAVSDAPLLSADTDPEMQLPNKDCRQKNETCSREFLAYPILCGLRAPGRAGS